MVARIPLIVNPDAAQIQELPATDTIDFPVATLTADGTIAANAPVTLTSAGKVKAISTVAENLTGGSTGTFLTGSGSQAIYSIEDTCWLGGQNAVIAAWKIKSSTASLDQDLQLTAGTLSGTSVSWGTRLDTGSETGGTQWVNLASNNNDKAILMYHESADSAMKIRTFTVSGTTITLGTEVTLRTSSSYGSLDYLGEDGGSSYFAAAFVHSGDACVKIIKHDGQNNMTVTAAGDAGFQIPSGFNHTNEMKVIGMSHDRFLVQAGANSQTNTIHVCTRLGTTCRIAPGYRADELGESNEEPFRVTDHTYAAYLHDGTDETFVYDPINEKFIIWVSAGSGARGRVRVYNIDGDTIKYQFESDFVTAADVNNGIATGHPTFYPSLEVTDKGQIIVTFSINSNKYGKRVVGSYNHKRDGITWGAITSWSNEWTTTIQQVKADDGKIIVIYQDTNQAGNVYNISGKSKVFQTATTTLTEDNFLGFSSAAYSNNDAARIKLLGNTTTKSGLTIGKKYYVQDDGTLATSKGSFNVPAGKALSATSLLITPV